MGPPGRDRVQPQQGSDVVKVIQQVVILGIIQGVILSTGGKRLGLLLGHLVLYCTVITCAPLTAIKVCAGPRTTKSH